VPPDYFSETGQLWGNPLYRWNSGDSSTAEKLLNWWTLRFKAMFDLVDVARVDHFRGFQGYWAVPAEEETALNGSWEPGPGPHFFEKIYKNLGELRIIAEDLGEISTDVIKLRDKFGFPGMKVLQFAFDNNAANPFLPHNYTTPNCVVYTGTHDNDTTLGWFLSSQLNESLREEIKRFANREMHDASPIHQDLIYLAMSSTASLAVIPLQDLLGFGSDCRMNIPGVAEGNWRWRCAGQFLTDELADQVKELTRRFGRC
jgi:4-alpha-glucanotransferase